MKTISLFHRKILRGFLKLSQSSPIPSLHFLLGEIPIEAKVHLNTFSLFHTIWSNPHTTAHKVMKYILRMSNNSSVTWSIHVRLLCLLYGLPDPLHLLENEAVWPKEKWKTLTKTRVTIYHESNLRSKAESNSKMDFLNVNALGLTGRPHPALHNLATTQDADKSRVHIKFLAGDFLTGELLAAQSGGNPICKLCESENETTEHIITRCRALSSVRDRVMPEMLYKVAEIAPRCEILTPNNNTLHRTQFLLDCTSLNLPQNFRISNQNPRISEVFKITRDLCYALARERVRKLKKLKSQP